MRKTLKIRMFSLAVAIITVFMLFNVLSSTGAFAVEDRTASMSVQDVDAVKEGANFADSSFFPEAFSNKTVSTCEYIYNLDDSPDYIYVAFEEGGYALFASATMEMMEYSPVGELPYSASTAKNYYAGPTHYWHRVNSEFFDLQTNMPLSITSEDAIAFSEQTRTLIESKTAYRSDVALEKSNIEEKVAGFLNSNANARSGSGTNSAPNLDKNNLITPDLEDLEENATLIPNYRYFLVNPTHGRNVENETYGNGYSGTCGPVAAQILLGYHNYYSDRRIIPDRFLNGYDDTAQAVTVTEQNPNFCIDPMQMTSEIIGTRSHSGANDVNSFYLEMISRIMGNDKHSSSDREVKNGIDEYLSERISGYLVDYEDNDYWIFNSVIDPSIITGEIDDGRPIIISMGELLGGSNHNVVGYGYQDYDYPDGGGNYDGYIVHFGWEGRTCVWINSSWCDGYVSLKINHTHDYRETTRNGRTEYECDTCGHRTDYAINMEYSPRYAERVAWVSDDELIVDDVTEAPYKDYYVTFETAGSMLFQTFSDEDTLLYLYDAEYNQLTTDDNDGWEDNALFYYTVQANTPYIVRVKFKSNATSGFVKLALTPASYECANYEEIDNVTGTNDSFFVDAYLDTTYIMTFTPTQTGTYKIALNYVDVYLDTVLYVINPNSNDLIAEPTSNSSGDSWYNDDGAPEKQALLTKTLTAGTPYFIVISTYDIELEEGTIDVLIRKMS